MIKVEQEDGLYKEYDSFEAMVNAWREEEKSWPWYKKLYYAWIRGPYWPPKIWYWIRTHTYNRYHVLDMRNRFYNWGWCDRCDLLLYASFNILCKYVEEERPPKQSFREDIDGEDKHWDKAYKEMYVLYDWWTKERKEHGSFDKEAGDKDQEMLHRLVAIRQYLWT